MTQAGLKWLKSIGYRLPENIRCSYNGNWHYASLCFTVFPELEALLPIPGHATKTAIIYVNVPHFDYGSLMFGLFKTDNNTSMGTLPLLSLNIISHFQQCNS